ncbi:7-deoxyloganetin glucosyltransferase-like [Chenopodium quinoa]|uniref:Glycosyltransferase n=1 Tax=Chenopodium quinoa TaxID=63459 RepID=A0A803MJ26_CHEQI|nr:7-deoxyloganetin glucosyltransferase-like [Chenopodium quinoa]
MENHVVCVPFPAQGHIRPMLKLTQLLHFKFEFSITFINTHHIHQTLFKNHHRSPEDDDPKDILSAINSIVTNKLELPLKELLVTKLLDNYNSNSDCLQPRVSCMISDVGMSSFTLRVAEELGIRAVLLETASACSLLAYFHCRQLLDKGIIPLQDQSCLTNGYLEKSIDWISSLKRISLKDMPSFIRTLNPNDMNHMMLNIVMSNAHRALKSEAILINTFDALEQHALEDLSTIFPNIHPIGPLNLMVDHHISKKDTINSGPLMNSNEYMKWLDSQEPKSVLYVSFGSLVGVDQETFIELAWGLANSLTKFLWIVRSDQVIEKSCTIEFNRFKEEINGRGVLVTWCDQEQVLAHPSIGGFFTHCGWNSTIESISYGVPMICWPSAADQLINSWYCCNCLGIGMKMSEHVKRDYVERVVKELMETKNGKEMGTKAAKWRNIAIEATMSSHGSSYDNLKKVVNNVIKVHQ